MLIRNRHRNNTIIPDSVSISGAMPSLPQRPGVAPAPWSPDLQQHVVRRVGRCQEPPAVTEVTVVAGGSFIPEQRTGPVPADWVADPMSAQTLWDALILTRATSPVISAAEDEVFRFYLPLAHTLARRLGTNTADPMLADLAVQAAELGLANAVLAWRRTDSRAFTAFARGAITAQIRRTQDARRPGRWSPDRTEAVWDTAITI